MSGQLKIKIKLTKRVPTDSVSNTRQTVDDTDRLTLQGFIESQKNYSKWGSFDSDDYDKAVEFRKTVEKYMDKVQRAEIESYSRSKDGYYDYARWLLTGDIPKLSKPRRSVKWLAKLDAL